MVNLTSVPALVPPAWSSVRPGKMRTRFVPNDRKAAQTPRSKPDPYARRRTTVAIPQAIPSMVQQAAATIVAQRVVGLTGEIDDH